MLLVIFCGNVVFTNLFNYRILSENFFLHMISIGRDWPHCINVWTLVLRLSSFSPCKNWVWKNKIKAWSNDGKSIELCVQTSASTLLASFN